MTRNLPRLDLLHILRRQIQGRRLRDRSGIEGSALRADAAFGEDGRDDAEIILELEEIVLCAIACLVERVEEVTIRLDGNEISSERTGWFVDELEVRT